MLLSAILEAFFWFLTWACSLFILHLWLLCLWLSHLLHTQSCFILVFFCLVLVVWCQLTVAFKSGAKTQKRDVYHEKQNLPGGYVHMEVNPIRLQSCSFWSGTFALQKHHWPFTVLLCCQGKSRLEHWWSYGHGPWKWPDFTQWKVSCAKRAQFFLVPHFVSQLLNSWKSAVHLVLSLAVPQTCSSVN